MPPSPQLPQNVNLLVPGPIGATESHQSTWHLTFGRGVSRSRAEEMYADVESRGGILEPPGIVEARLIGSKCLRT